MKDILRKLKNIGPVRKASGIKRKMLLSEHFSSQPSQKKYHKRKVFYLQTSLNIPQQKKMVWYSYITVGVGLIAILCFLSFSNTFALKNIEIIRYDNISDINLGYAAVDPFRGKSLFQVDTNKMIERIHSYQNNINSVQIQSSLPDTLIIKIGSFPALFHTEIQNTQYIVTQNGSLVPSRTNNELKKMSIIFRNEPRGVIDYKQILDASHIQKIQYIVQKVEQNIVNTRVEEIVYLPLERETHIKLDSGTLLIFDIAEDVEEQIEKTAVFYTEYSQALPYYLDLRIRGKIFLCTQDISSTCQKNLRQVYGTSIGVNQN